VVHYIEKRLLNDNKCVTTPLMELFGINSYEHNSKILIMLSTTMMLMLTFELITRTTFLFKSWLF
jgi:hypothetical protein